MSSEKAITHGESVIGQMDGGLQGKRRQAKACFGRAKIRSKNWARAPTLRHTERLDLTAETERVKWYAVFCGLFQRATVLVSRQGLWTCARSTTRREAALLCRCSLLLHWRLRETRRAFIWVQATGQSTKATSGHSYTSLPHRRLPLRVARAVD